MSFCIINYHYDYYCHDVYYQYFYVSNIIAFITTDVNSSVIIFVMIIIFCTFI